MALPKQRPPRLQGHTPPGGWQAPPPEPDFDCNEHGDRPLPVWARVAIVAILAAIPIVGLLARGGC